MRWSVLAAVLVACGGGRTGATDAPRPTDAAGDAPVDTAVDAADPFVRVHVHLDPPPAIAVLFYDPANQLVARVTPDATGLAEAALPTGGTVLAFLDPITNSMDDVRAIFGVEPGDDLDLVPIVNPPIPTDSMTITVPSEPGASAYRVGSRCGVGYSTSPSVQVYLVYGCQGPLDVLADALDGANQLLAAQRGTVTAADRTTASLTGAWLPADTLAIHVSSGDDRIGFAAYLAPIVDATPLDSLERFGALTLDPHQTGTISLQVEPGALVDGRRLLLTIGDPAHVNVAQAYRRFLAPTDPAIDFDAATEELPWYDPNDVSTYDPATRTLSLARSAGGAALDGQLVRLQFSGQTPPSRAWNLEVPPDTTVVTLPALPADLRALDPSDVPVDFREVGPSGIRSTSFQGYRDLRRGVPVSTAVGSTYDVVTIPLSPL